jgi:hypothetical protein
MFEMSASGSGCSAAKSARVPPFERAGIAFERPGIAIDFAGNAGRGDPWERLRGSVAVRLAAAAICPAALPAAGR